MADEPSWDDIFRPAGQQPAPPPPPAPAEPEQPTQQLPVAPPFGQQYVPPQPGQLQGQPQSGPSPYPAPQQYPGPEQAAGQHSAAQLPPQQPAPQAVPSQPYPTGQQPHSAPQPPETASPTQQQPYVPQPYAPPAVAQQAAAWPQQPASSDSWDAILSGVGVAPSAEQPMSRRDSRAAAEAAAARSAAGSAGGGRGGSSRGTGSSGGRKKRRLTGLWIAIGVVVVLVIGGGVGWAFFGDRIKHYLGWEEPNDYATSGNGTAVTVVIAQGDIGEDVAHTLADDGVTKTFDAPYQYLIAHPEISFVPGSYGLQQQMSAASAISALQDPKNRITNSVTIPEGVSASKAMQLIADGTGISIDDLKAEAKNYKDLGVPDKAHSIEGFLFPATYQFDPNTTAHDALKLLVDTMIQHLDSAGVKPENYFKVVDLAALVQRESGPSVSDMHKIARVFTNRLSQGMLLESDASVAYGTGHTDTVWTTDAERADASNKYNTYVHPGLPYGPIGLPGDNAIDAALHPTKGSWLYFVPVNLKTGQTVFSTTEADHEAAVAQLQAWCAKPENASYCQ